MGIDIEWLPEDGKKGIIRVGNELNKFLDPYDFVVFIHIEGDTAHLKGGCGKFDNKYKKQILEKLCQCGISKITWERIRKDGSIHVVGPLVIGDSNE